MPDVAEDIDDIASELKVMPAGTQASPGFVAQLPLILHDLRSSPGAIPERLRSTLACAAALLAGDPS